MIGLSDFIDLVNEFVIWVDFHVEVLGHVVLLRLAR